MTVKEFLKNNKFKYALGPNGSVIKTPIEYVVAYRKPPCGRKQFLLGFSSVHEAEFYKEALERLKMTHVKIIKVKG